ncbi:MAG: hypothetical protein Q7Q71_11005 [Verrucomicrobiota bacterium JB023]|nr:hypothetical protein [Verrucomicrobiota bacterium JB023]
MRLAPLLCALLLLPIESQSCLWDQDTIREEFAEAPSVFKTLAGWFNRYPPLYYEMRLERVTEELASQPESLSLYDDAAVSCDRLGRHDEAIEWMAKKVEYLHLEPADAPQPTHRYRTLANLGTFHAHRWGSQAPMARKADKTDLEQAIKHVSSAIEENPDAHFGREVMQLMVLEWLAEDHMEEGVIHDLVTRHASNLQLHGHHPKEICEGLDGLIRLGNAWRSPDIHYLYMKALWSNGYHYPSLIAGWRAEELLSERGSFRHPILNELAISPLQAALGSKEDHKLAIAYGKKARAAAAKRHEARTTYLLGKLKKGLHPDTHPGFWNDWKEPAFPKPPFQPMKKVKKHFPVLVLTFGGIPLLISLGLFLFSRVSGKKSSA